MIPNGGVGVGMEIGKEVVDDGIGLLCGCSLSGSERSETGKDGGVYRSTIVEQGTDDCLDARASSGGKKR